MISMEIQQVYEEIIQLEQGLIELDEQNTINEMDIRKREAKVFLLSKQIDDIEESIKEAIDQNEQEELRKEREQLERKTKVQKEQILILNQSTEENLQKRHWMKEDLYQSYQQIRNIRESTL